MLGQRVGATRERVVERAHITRADVLADQHLVASKILEDHSDPLAQSALFPLPKVEPIQENPPFGGWV